MNVTVNSWSFQVGVPVIVLSTKGDSPEKGYIRYVGETEFAHGAWVGVQLDSSKGEWLKNLSCNVTHDKANWNWLFINAMSGGAQDPQHVITGVGTFDTVSVHSCLHTEYACYCLYSNFWSVVPVGKNNGTVQGKSYFSCKPGHGVFVRHDRLLLDKKRSHKAFPVQKVTINKSPATPPAAAKPTAASTPSYLKPTRSSQVKKTWEGVLTDWFRNELQMMSDYLWIVLVERYLRGPPSLAPLYCLLHSIPTPSCSRAIL